MKKYLLIAYFCLSSSIYGKSHFVPNFTDMTPDKVALAKKYYGLITTPHLSEQPKKRWGAAIKLAKTGDLEKVADEVSWKVDRDGTWHDKIRINIWYKLREHVISHKLIGTILAILIAWPAGIKAYRWKYPRVSPFTARIEADKDTCYVGESSCLTLHFSGTDTDNRYELRVLPMSSDDTLNGKSTIAESYLKGKEKIEYNYTPSSGTDYLPTFTIKDRQGSQGFGFHVPYFGKVWYVEPYSPPMVLVPEIVIKDWNVVKDESVSPEDEIIFNITLSASNHKKGINDFLNGIKIKIKPLGGLKGKDKLDIKRSNFQIRIKNLKQLTFGQAKDNTTVLKMDIIYQDKTESVNISLDEVKQSIFFKNKQDLENYQEAHQHEVDTGESGLIYAAKKDYLEAVKFYVEMKNADVKTQDKHGHTVLDCATGIYNDLKVAKYLIDKGALVKAKDEDISGILYQAMVVGDLETLKNLIAAGVNVKAKDQGGWTALHYAVLFKIAEIVEYLIEVGIDVNAQTSRGYTALHWAITRDSVKIAKLLIGKGADASIKDGEGRTPLDVAKDLNHQEMINYLSSLS